MHFKQFVEVKTSTYTYLLADEDSKECVLIDPVFQDIGKYLEYVNEHRLNLKYTIDTHVHADHITGSGELKNKVNCEYIIHEKANLGCALKDVKHNSEYNFGKHVIKVLFTPGHTDHHISLFVNDRVFTGDCLFINGCGRTDFQGGSAEEQWNSIFNILYKLPDDILVYPGHDYNKRRVSSIAQEKDINVRTVGYAKESFIKQMNELHLPDPKYIHEAVPLNLKCGLE